LQFAEFRFACFEFNPRPPHSGSIGEVWALQSQCISTASPLASDPKFSKCARPNGCVDLVHYFSQLLLPFQP
jgi:hypothetical protein